MNREDVIQIATEARKESGKSVLVWFEKFAERVEAKSAAAERERCAKVCEDRGNRNRTAANLPNADRDEFYCADDIRALGDE